MQQADNPAFFERICLIGIGLIGSSLARVIRAENLCKTLVIADADPAHLQQAEELALGDVYCADTAVAVEEADLVILCTPVGQFAKLAPVIAPHLKSGAIVSDVGSVKQVVLRDMAPYMPEEVHLIPAHPIAGTEKSGPTAGFATLFKGRWAILTPPEEADPAAVDRLCTFWRACGSKTQIMTPDHHDKVLAITSHLPHLIAYTIVGTATDLETHLKEEVIEYSASGFRDFTRIAASDPVMWRDVFLHNREAVLEILQRFTEDLTALQRAIRWGEGEALQDAFTRTRTIRRAIIDAHQDQ